MMSSLTATVSAGSRLEQKTPAEYLPYSTDMLLCEYDAYSGKSGLQSRNRPISEKTESEKVRALPVHHKQPLGESFSLGRNKSKLQQIFPSTSVDRNIRISSEIQVEFGNHLIPSHSKKDTVTFNISHSKKSNNSSNQPLHFKRKRKHTAAHILLSGVRNPRKRRKTRTLSNFTISKLSNSSDSINNQDEVKSKTLSKKEIKTFSSITSQDSNRSLKSLICKKKKSSILKVKRNRDKNLNISQEFRKKRKITIQSNQTEIKTCISNTSQRTKLSKKQVLTGEIHSISPILKNQRIDRNNNNQPISKRLRAKDKVIYLKSKVSKNNQSN